MSDRSRPLRAAQPLDWQALEAIAHRDPGGRGLASYRVRGLALDAGQLQAAATHLAEQAADVAIVTGFPVLADRVTAETDGPPGALFLAEVLRAEGIAVTLIADRHALPLVSCGCQMTGGDPASVLEFPDFQFQAAQAGVDAWVEAFFDAGRGRTLSHLVAIERPGPSHTLASLAAQPRDGRVPRALFEAEVPAADRDVCHTMRGANIDRYTAPTHRLFEAVRRKRLPIATIGIGDGGNEIGMGRFSWEQVREAVGGAAAGRIACRVATDYALVAGVSNWGAYALGLGVARLRGTMPRGRWLTPDGQRQLVAAMVTNAGAVDGRTLRCEPTVDGLPWAASARVLEAMYDLIGGPDAPPA